MDLPADDFAFFDPSFSKEQCSSPSRKEQKRTQYRQVKAHMQKEDGRVTAHGWSLPGKYKVGNNKYCFSTCQRRDRLILFS